MDKIESALFETRLSVIESTLCQDKEFKERYISVFESLIEVINMFDDNPTSRLEISELFRKHLEKIEGFR